MWKKITFSLFLVSLTFSLYSQNEASIWYFGSKAGVDFRGGSPVAITDGQLETSEGCATVADSSGQLLFYTDGITVWNKNHVIMSNGNGLMGNPSSSQAAVIVQKPGSSTLYYIFTTTEHGLPSGFRYSEVDISLDGGLGAVTTKNVLLSTPTCEKIATVRKLNGVDYWIIVHGFQNNNFLAYSFTSSGINANPVVSSVGSRITTISQAAGYLKASLDGTRLVSANYGKNIELFDFNAVTGVVSNLRFVVNKTGSYGVEFSPSGNLLYATTGNGNIFDLVQYNLTVPDIAASERLIGTRGPLGMYGALQMGPDKKIYVAESDQDFLSVINQPEIVGNGCNYSRGAVPLDSRYVRFGLPQYSQEAFRPAATIFYVCQSESDPIATRFSVYLGNGESISSIYWNFGDGNASAEQIPAHAYADPGIYFVIARVVSSLGNVHFFAMEMHVSITPSAEPITDQYVCGQLGMIYDLTQHDSRILGGQTDSSLKVGYFLSEEDAEDHDNMLSGSYNLAAVTTTIYAKVYHENNEECAEYINFKIILSPAYANLASTLLACDDSSLDGVEVFNFDSQSSVILGNQSSSEFRVTYHVSLEDAQDGDDAINNYRNTSNPQTIHARVEKISDPNCYALTYFEIKVVPAPLAKKPDGMLLCSEANSLKATFDLRMQDIDILNGQSPADYIISYHALPSEAITGRNALSDDFESSQDVKTIYARVTLRGGTCFAITDFDLRVFALPVIAMQPTYVLCENNRIFLTAPAGFDLYEWSNGAETQSIWVDDAIKLELTVTKNYGNIQCANTKEIEVVKSSPPVLKEIIISDWTYNQNSINVIVEGFGDYEYSIDGNVYQESPNFYSLAPGSYTVYVRDKYECGFIEQEIYILMYPKFFTPNGDSYNERWQVKFSSFEPRLVVYIYDRYGKLLTSFNGHNPGWDGTYNNHTLPATDYWFVVHREDGRIHKGHFSLLR